MQKDPSGRCGKFAHPPGLWTSRGGGLWHGDGNAARKMEVHDFWMATTPVIQALWTHVMQGTENPSAGRGVRRSLENMSWKELHRAGGFLERINRSEVCARLAAQAGLASAVLRLPSEAEWEYAARGGPKWRDGFRYSGGNDIDLVGWYERKAGDQTKDVALKAPNQLGIYDMSGNVWEWCLDSFTDRVESIPADGTPYQGENHERVLRGGCFHNWAIHCTVSKRYQIGQQFHDGCIGLRLVMSGHNE